MAISYQTLNQTSTESQNTNTSIHTSISIFIYSSAHMSEYMTDSYNDTAPDNGAMQLTGNDSIHTESTINHINLLIYTKYVTV